MNKRNRRVFLQASAGALASGLTPIGAALRGGDTAGDLASDLSAVPVAPTIPANEDRKPLRIGLIIGIGRAPAAAMGTVHDLDLPTCQVFVSEVEPELAARLRQALTKYQLEAP